MCVIQADLLIILSYHIDEVEVTRGVVYHMNISKGRMRKWQLPNTGNMLRV
jgi:hypothetical protein